MEDRVGRSQGPRRGVAEEKEELELEPKLGGNGKVPVREVCGVREPRLDGAAKAPGRVP
jgi:hypothetical protein